MSVATEYRGHTIRWSDNEDCWTCYDLSDKVRSSLKLSNIKAAIDRLYLAERKEAGVECWEISPSEAKRTASKVVEYLGVKENRHYFTRELQSISYNVAVVAKRYGSDRPARAQTECSSLGKPGAEFEAAWETYISALADAKAAQKRASDAYSALPRLTVDDISKLVELAHKGETE
jgi:hypothetical protein